MDNKILFMGIVYFGILVAMFFWVTEIIAPNYNKRSPKEPMPKFKTKCSNMEVIRYNVDKSCSIRCSDPERRDYKPCKHVCCAACSERLTCKKPSFCGHAATLILNEVIYDEPLIERVE